MSWLERFQNNRNALGWAFMLPAAVLLLLFLTYPLGLGTWLGFTDAKVGRSGHFVGLENFEFLVGDSVTRLALFNTLFYTAVASTPFLVDARELELGLNEDYAGVHGTRSDLLLYETEPLTGPDPSPAPPAAVPSAASQEGRTTAAAATRALPSADDLIAQGGLPPLHLDLHVYAGNPAERFVFVNTRKYREGETLQEGPTIEELTRDGAVLSYRGSRFVLGRP